MDLAELRRQAEERYAKFPTKHIKESFGLIDKITGIKECNLIIPAIKTEPFPAIFTKNEDRGFNVSFEGINELNRFIKEDGWMEPALQLKSEYLQLELNDLYLSGTSNTLKLNREDAKCFSGSMIVNLEIQGFSLKAKEISFYRQIIRIDSFDAPRFLNCTLYNLKDISNTLGLFQFKINENNYSLFSTKWNGEEYLIIDCEEQIDFETFSDQSYSVFVALGFITCNFHQDECWFIEGSDKDFVELKNISYRILRKSIRSNYNPIYGNPYSYYRMKDLPVSVPKQLTLVSELVFSNLCNEILDNEKLLGALIIFMEGHNLSVYSRGAAYSVTLETLTQMIAEKNSGFKPIVNDTLSNNLTKDLLTVLEKYKTQICNPDLNPKNEFVESVRILERKIEGLNSPTNKDKLSIPFQIYKIDIVPGSEEDKAISHRNSFLHGYELRKSKKEYLSDYEVWGVTLNLLNLLNKLILKYVGYEGYMINYAEFHLNKKEPNPDNLFLKI